MVTMKARIARFDSDALTLAADGSIDIDVHGDRATARFPKPDGARFVFKKVVGKWLIDSTTRSTRRDEPADIRARGDHDPDQLGTLGRTGRVVREAGEAIRRAAATRAKTI